MNGWEFDKSQRNFVPHKGAQANWQQAKTITLVQTLGTQKRVWDLCWTCLVEKISQPDNSYNMADQKKKKTPTICIKGTNLGNTM